MNTNKIKLTLLTFGMFGMLLASAGTASALFDPNSSNGSACPPTAEVCIASTTSPSANSQRTANIKLLALIARSNINSTAKATLFKIILKRLDSTTKPPISDGKDDDCDLGTNPGSGDCDDTDAEIRPNSSVNTDPNPADKDCKDFKSQTEAQQYFDRKGGSPSNNVDGLDRDGDGEACENNSYSSSTVKRPIQQVSNFNDLTLTNKSSQDTNDIQFKLSFEYESVVDYNFVTSRSPEALKFDIVDSDYDVVANQDSREVSSALTSSATRRNNFYRIDEDGSEKFTLSVVYENDDNELYSLVLRSLDYRQASESGPVRTVQIDDKFQTKFITS